MTRKILLIIATLFISQASAQDDRDSLELIFIDQPQNNLSTKFDKQLNTYFLNSKFFLNTDLDNFQFNFSENYNSTFIKTANKSIRDENYFSLSSAYKLSPQLNFGISASNNILSDNRKIEINQASSSNALLFTRYSPYSNITVSPYFGYSNNRQIGESDYGYLYGADGVINPAERDQTSDFNIYSELKFRNEDISPRKNTIRHYSLVLTNNFSDSDSNNINGIYSQNRKDFYYEADSVISKQYNIVNNLQSRIETNYLLQDRFQSADFLNLFTVDILGSVFWRTVDRNTRYKPAEIISSSVYDTKINELKLELESIASFTSSKFNGSLRIIYSERDEKHLAKNFKDASSIFFEDRVRQESSKNNNSLRASISFIGSLNISASDKLYFSFFQNKLRYDTPSSENFDDRDEILSIARIRYSKQLTPFFEAFANVEGTLNHIVYIFAEKSSNNNINRIIKLSSGGNYIGKKFSSLNNFEVTANYTVYDFEDLNPTYRSFSFRQFTAIDSTLIKLHKQLSVSLYGYVKLSEQGELKWISFSTRPTRFLEEIYGEPKINFKYNKILFSIGARYFSINTYSYKLREKLIESKYLSIGPVTEIYLFINSLSFRFHGWYEFIKINNINEREQANLIMEMNWNF